MLRGSFEWGRRPGGIILDGATGTCLQEQGVEVGCALWGSVALLDEEGRALTRQLHRRYADAGADLVIANTHNASLAYCRRFLEETPISSWPSSAAGATPERALMRALNLQAVDEARAGVQDAGARVAGCLASPDRPYAVTPSLSAAEVAAALEPQLEVLVAAGPDVLLFEMCTTDSDLDGVAVAAASAPIPVGVGLVCGDDGRLLGGLEIAEAVARLEPARPEMLFIQCTRWDGVARPLVELLAAAGPEILVGAYGNDGRTWVDGRWTGPRVQPEVYADAAAEWWKLGARAVGGCCGTTPEHIEALVRRLAPLRS